MRIIRDYKRRLELIMHSKTLAEFRSRYAKEFRVNPLDLPTQMHPIFIPFDQVPAAIWAMITIKILTSDQELSTLLSTDSLFPPKADPNSAESKKDVYRR